jgi:hypothetical protein
MPQFSGVYTHILLNGVFKNQLLVPNGIASAKSN